jgi:hypothetical protein
MTRLKMRGIRDSGIPEKERLVLDVVEDDDIGDYVVFHTHIIRPRVVSTRVRQTFWFPDRAVRSGDVIVLYTKKGKTRERENSDGTTSHFFYWNLDEPIWADRDFTAVLVGIEQWEIAEREAE